MRDADRDANSASGDPAMVLTWWMAFILPIGAGKSCRALPATDTCPSSPSRRSAAGRTSVWHELWKQFRKSCPVRAVGGPHRFAWFVRKSQVWVFETTRKNARERAYFQLNDECCA